MKSSILTSIFNIILSFSPFSKQPKITTIIFDSTDVLVHSDMDARMGVVGFGNLFANLMSPQKLTKTFYYDQLRRLSASEQAKNLAQGRNAIKDEKGRIYPPIMHDYHLGNISGQEIYNKLDNLNYEEESDKDLVLGMAKNMLPETLADLMEVDQEMLELVKALKNSGYKVAIFSNFEKSSFDLLKQKYPELYDLFDEIILSSEINDIKPNSTAFLKAAQKLQVNPKVALMIDDKVQNILGAKKAGMKGHVFKSVDDLRTFMNKLEIKLKGSL